MNNYDSFSDIFTWRVTLQGLYVPGPDQDWHEKTLSAEEFFNLVVTYASVNFPKVPDTFSNLKESSTQGGKCTYCRLLEEESKKLISFSENQFEYIWQINDNQMLDSRFLIKSLVKLLDFIKRVYSDDYFQTETPNLSIQLFAPQMFDLNLSELGVTEKISFTPSKKKFLNYFWIHSHADARYTIENWKLLVFEYARTLLSQIDSVSGIDWHAEIDATKSELADSLVLKRLILIVNDEIDMIENIRGSHHS